MQNGERFYLVATASLSVLALARGLAVVRGLGTGLGEVERGLGEVERAVRGGVESGVR